MTPDQLIKILEDTTTNYLQAVELIAGHLSVINSRLDNLEKQIEDLKVIKFPRSEKLVNSKEKN